jgi:hypothetical protein
MIKRTGLSLPPAWPALMSPGPSTFSSSLVEQAHAHVLEGTLHSSKRYLVALKVSITTDARNISVSVATRYVLKGSLDRSSDTYRSMHGRNGWKRDGDAS